MTTRTYLLFYCLCCCFFLYWGNNETLAQKKAADAAEKAAALIESDSSIIQTTIDSIATDAMDMEVDSTTQQADNEAIIDSIPSDSDTATEPPVPKEVPADLGIDLLNYTNPKTFEIGGITISGTKFLDKKILTTLSGLGVGDKVTVPGEEIPRAVKKLWKQGLFSDVKITATKVVNEVIFLDFALKERVRLSKFTFSGVKKGEEDDLRESIGLIRGRIVNENLLNNTKNTILNFFRNKGFLNASVELGQTIDKQFSNSVILTLDVKRGNRIKINEIIFKDNHNTLTRKLKKQMSGTKEKSTLNKKAGKNIWRDLKKANIPHMLGNLTFSKFLNYVDNNIFRFKIFSSSKYIEDDFESDKQAVIAYYNSLGYRDAKVVSDSIYFVDNKSVNIEVKIDEGEPYYFRNIEWKGNSKYDKEVLTKILGIEKGDIYDQDLLQARLFLDPNSSDVSSLYMDDGYLFFNVTPMEKAVEGDSIDLLINIYEGPQATINKVNIMGNTKTNEHVIRRELRSMPGNKFSRSDIIRSQREIATLGFFDPEQIEVLPKPNPEKGTVDIDYKVAEKPSDQLELSAGWGGNTIVGSIGVSFNNFSLRNIFNKEAWRPLPAGDGQRLSFRFQSTGRAYQGINMSFTEPWLGGKRPNSLTFSLFSSRYQRISSNALLGGAVINTFDDGTGDITGRLLITGASIGLGRRLRFPDDNFALQTSLSFQHYNLKDWASNFIVDNGVMNNITFSNTLSRYSINQPIYPSSGSNISLSVELTPPYSLLNNKDYSTLGSSEKYRWSEYHKWKFKAEWYTKIVGNLVLKTSAKMGFMGYYNSDIGHSPLERFQVGGDGISNTDLLSGIDIVSLRGYDIITNNIITAQENVLDENGLPTFDDSGNPVFANRAVRVADPYYAKYTMELRYALSLNPNSTVYALAFVEAGNSWSNFRDINPFQLRRSAGLGFRVFLPMFGTLGFDYGVGFDQTNSRASTGVWDYIGNNGRFSVVLGIEPE